MRAETIRVLVAGLPRAGTTWVAQALGHTPAAVYVHEPDNHRHTLYALRAKRGLGAFPFLEGGDEAREYGRLWDRAFDGEQAPRKADMFLGRFQSRADHVDLDAVVTPGGHAPILLKSLAAMSRAPKVKSTSTGPVIVKTVQASLALEWIATRAGAQVVVVHRHPLNVISSWLEMGYNDLGAVPSDVAAHYCARWGADPAEPSDSILARTAWRVGFHTSVLEDTVQANPEFIGVSHDRLCGDPVNGLRQLAERCGLAWSEMAESFVCETNRPGFGYDVHRISADQPGRWRERLTNAQADEALAVLAAFPVGRCAAEAIS